MFFQRHLELQSGNSRGEKKLGDGVENGGHLSQKNEAGSRRAIRDLTSLRIRNSVLSSGKKCPSEAVQAELKSIHLG